MCRGATDRPCSPDSPKIDRAKRSSFGQTNRPALKMVDRCVTTVKRVDTLHDSVSQNQSQRTSEDSRNKVLGVKIVAHYQSG